MMISQFWSLCRACPALDVDKVSAMSHELCPVLRSVILIMLHPAVVLFFACPLHFEDDSILCGRAQSSIIYRSATLLRLLLPFQWRVLPQNFLLEVWIKDHVTF